MPRIMRGERIAGGVSTGAIIYSVMSKWPASQRAETMKNNDAVDGRPAPYLSEKSCTQDAICRARLRR